MDFLHNLFGKKQPLADKEIDNSRIARMRLFVEPPAYLDSMDYGITGLPKDFINTADKELDLGGELVSYFKGRGNDIPIEKIPRINNSEVKSFFSQQAKSELWELYFASGTSGVRYSILVEFKVHETRSPRSEEARRQIFADYEELWDKATIEYTFDCLQKGKTPDTFYIANEAMSSASYEVMRKHGISKKEMTDIIVEGSKNWTKFKGEGKKD